MGMTVQEWDTLLQRIRSNDPELTILDLCEEALSAESVQALAVALKQNHTLSALDLGHDEIGAGGAQALANALKDNHTLSLLNLNGNQIGDAGAQALANALKDNHALSFLILYDNQIGAAGAQALANALKDNHTLCYLILGYDQIGDREAQQIDALLKRNQQLRLQLHAAVTSGDLSQVQSLLQQGVSITSTTDTDENTGNTPLHWAIIHQQLLIARYLITQIRQQGLPLNITNKAGKTPQQLAAGTPLTDIFTEPTATPASSTSHTVNTATSFITALSVNSAPVATQASTTLPALALIPAAATLVTAPTSVPPTVSASSSSADMAIPPATLAGLQTIPWSELGVMTLKGHGGFGDVYHATWHGTPVAVKQLHLKVMTPDTQAAFNQETRMMAQCQFPNVIKLFGVAIDQTRCALVMEYMPRGSLYTLLHNAADPFLWVPTRWTIALDVGRGLSYLHAKNIIHRDLKSHNVLIDERYHAKIADFGLAKVKSETKNTTTNLSATAGSTRWRAPELFKQKATHNKETDVYSYAMVLCEIATREMPYGDDADEDVVKDWIKANDKPELPPTTPSGYLSVTQQCYDTVPSKRLSAAQAVAALDTAFQALPTPQAPPIVAKSWHFDADANTTTVDAQKGYALLAAGPTDCRKIADFYAYHPVPGSTIRSVQVIHNPQMNRVFYGRLALLQNRHGNTSFTPQWSSGTNPAWRRAVNGLAIAMAQPYQDTDFPNVNLLPLWHGTKPAVIDGLCSSGYANLAKTDTGFFGKGIYSAHEAEYAHRVYSKGTLVLNWVAFYSVYPTIDGDSNTLAGGANYQNYDAHFVPVVPKDPANSKEVNYYPTKPQQQRVYTEVVVFDSAQCLPRYLVELQPLLPKTLTLAKQAFFSAKQANQHTVPDMSDINLIDAAEYVWQHFLSKPYTLTHSSSGANWQTTDWSYTHQSTTIHRPNHGLAHTLRTVYYVPYVIDSYLAQQGHKFSPQQAQEIKAQTTAIQLALLFFVAGRENDMGSQDDKPAYKRFRENSAKAFENYITLKALAGFDAATIARYKDAIMAPEFHKSPLHVIIRASHDIDTLRCLDRTIYPQVMAALHPYIGPDRAEKLSALVAACLVNTGDRFRGNEYPRPYDPALFIAASSNVAQCQAYIEQGIAQWDAQQAMPSVYKKM